jgi:hypothetical protein
MNSQIVKYTSRNHDVVTGGAHGPGNLSGPSSGRPRHPLGKSPPRSRVGRPLGRNFASLEGSTPPRANLRLARGRPKLADSAPTPPTRALNALTRRERPGQRWIPATPAPWHRLGIVSQRCSTNPPCAGAVRQGWCQIRDTVPTTLVRPPRRTPRGRTAEPSKEVRMPTPRSGRTMSWRQASGACLLRHLRPVRPSPPLCRHPGHCSAIPGTVGPRDGGTSPHQPLCDFQPSVSVTLEPTYGRRPNKRLPHRYPRSRSWTGTRLATTLRQKQNSPGRSPTPRRCTPTATCRLELCGTIVNRLPLAYKMGRRSPGRGGKTDSGTLACFPPSPRCWHFASINLRDLEALPPLLPRL